MKLLLALNILISAVTLTVAIDANRISREHHEQQEVVSSVVDDSERHLALSKQLTEIRLTLGDILFSRLVWNGLTDGQRARIERAVKE